MRRLEIYSHTKKIIVFTLLFVLPGFICAAAEAAKAKPTTKSVVIISNKIDLKKITPGKPLTAGKVARAVGGQAAATAQTGTGASAPIIVDKNATVIKGDKKQGSVSGLRGKVIMTSPKK